jgi:hypothetical protein
VLSGCVTIEIPEVVSDAVKVSKDIYKGAAGDGSRSKIAHSYVGKESQTVAEIKQRCESEAARKLREVAQKEVAYVVIENQVTSVNDKVVANCNVAAAK